ncbi:MAG TPA: 4Fe-4S dicluster domain-containing protein [Deltaproteobacteria bacterium]|nr:4Fe-4S dicluster domain-containing protein [Deltaproteobacteria bacterium]HPR55309.1 4Fe-4S dicluster domain-containing protein [Deltaproteobacteria bacterium]HXK48478.1 4Fe-4S dicluster domain-containing protein [Deltaproteobacteria bacterium]
MGNVETKLREEAKKLLTEKKVDVVIGYERGTLPLTATPCFITDPAEADRLVFDATCTQNLAKFAHDILSAHREAQKKVKPEDKKKKVVGIVARGCTSRSLVIHLQEKQYARDDVVILGVPCSGYIDGRKLSAAVGGEEVLEGAVSGDSLTVKISTGEKKVALSDVYADNCITCRFNNPVISDVMTGDPAPAKSADKEYEKVEAFEKLSIEERWAYFTKEMAKCIRCYACRNTCPSCYCKVCFVEQSMPQFVGLSAEKTDTQVFQLLRTYHMVGRCVDCGSCVSVCPMGVDLRNFLKKLDKDALELFEHRAGASMDDVPPLSTYKENDKEDFIYNP